MSESPENASTVNCKYGKSRYESWKTARLENASPEKVIMELQGWKLQIRKNQVRNRKGGYCKYGKYKYGND
jgi:hypothetical protein